MSREDDLDKELRFHIDERIDALVGEGLTLEEARRRTRLEFGGVMQTKEAVRDDYMWPLVAGAWQDVRYAVRTMRRSPGFAAIAIASLALAIGANTAIFSLIDTLMLRPLPVRDPQHLVELVSRYPGEPDINGFSWRVYEHFRDQNHVFSDLFGTSGARFRVGATGADIRTIDGQY